MLEYQAEPGEFPRKDIKPIFRRGGYLHPIYSLSGKAITDDFPPNHIHHHGVWFSWSNAEFEGRVAAWRTSIEIARQRPLVGAGFAATEVKGIVDRFPTPGGLRTGLAAHSIYFQILGNHGIVGFLLYFGMIGFAILNTVRVAVIVHSRPELYWAGKMSRAIQLSIFGFLVGGAALSAAYYDLYLIVFGLSAVLLDYVRREVTGLNAAGVPSWKRGRQKTASTALQPAQRS